MIRNLRSATAVWCYVIAIAYVLGVWQVSATYRALPDYRSDMGGGVDTDNFMPALRGIHSFWGTLHWWRGSWIAGDKMVFFRPMTSTVWWIEWQLFGENGVTGFMAVSWTLFAIVTVMLFAFLRRLFEVRVAGLATVLWVSCAAEFVALPSPYWAPWHWKNDPEGWISICILGCFNFLLSYWRTDRKAYVAGAVFCMLLAICFKEMGYVTAPMALGFWAFQRYRNKVTKIWPIPLMFALSALFFAYRLAVIHRTLPANSNGSWIQRAEINLIAGRAAATINLGEYVPLAVACIFYALFLARRKKWIPTGALLALAAFCVWRNDAKSEFPFDAALKLMSIIPLSKAVIWQDAIYTAGIMWLWGDFLSKRDEVRVFAIGWYTLAYLPLMTAPIWQHALYLPSMGWGLFLAVFLLGVYDSAKGNIERLLRKPSGNCSLAAEPTT